MKYTTDLTFNFNFSTLALEANYLIGYTDGTTSTGYASHTSVDNYSFFLNSAFNTANANNKVIGFFALQHGVDTFNIVVPSYYDFFILNEGNDLMKQHGLCSISSGGTETFSSGTTDYCNLGMRNTGNYFDTFSSFTYSNYLTYTGINMLYDFGMLQTDEVYTTSNGFRFHQHYLEIYLSDYGLTENFTISLGSYVENARSEGYQNGYNEGYLSGYDNGYNTGYDDGYAIGHSGIDDNSATAFSYIGTAFRSVASIMELEILPHITLATCFSIPLVFILIITIFKLVKK